VTAAYLDVDALRIPVATQRVGGLNRAMW